MVPARCTNAGTDSSSVLMPPMVFPDSSCNEVNVPHSWITHFSCAPARVKANNKNAARMYKHFFMVVLYRGLTGQLSKSCKEFVWFSGPRFTLIWLDLLGLHWIHWGLGNLRYIRLRCASARHAIYDLRAAFEGVVTDRDEGVRPRHSLSCPTSRVAKLALWVCLAFSIFVNFA